MSDIRVENKIVMLPVNQIKPYVRNPRKNDKTVELLCKVIPKVGFNVPLVVDPNGVIVKGHARFSAALKLGMTELPCIVSHADEEAIKADRIADNKISEFSEWVNEELLHELDMLDFDLDMSELGFPTVSFDDIPAAEEFEAQFEEKPEISQEERQRLYQEFLEQQAKENAQPVQMTTERAIQQAKMRQADVPAAKPKYYKCICEKCGHVMYVREGDAMEAE